MHVIYITQQSQLAQVIEQINSLQMWQIKTNGKSVTMRQPVGIDVETYAIDKREGDLEDQNMHPRNSVIRTIQLGFYKMPEYFNIECDLDRSNLAECYKVFVIDRMKVNTSALVESVLSNPEYTDQRNFRLIAHNLPYELKHLRNIGAVLYPSWCTQRANMLIKGCNADLYQYVSLADLVLEMEGDILDKTEQLSDWSALELSKSQIQYAALDVKHLGSISIKQSFILNQQEQNRVADYEMKKLVAESIIHLNGLNIDSKAWVEACEEQRVLSENAKSTLLKLLPKRPIDPTKRPQLMESLARAGVHLPDKFRNTKKFWENLYEQAKREKNSTIQGIAYGFKEGRLDLAMNHLPMLEINPSSPKQMREALLTLLEQTGLSDEVELVTTGSKEVCFKFKDHDELKPVADALKAYKKHKKLSEFRKVINRVWDDGRLRPEMTTTVTSRQASSKPNLQQIPRNAQFRAAFTAPETYHIEQWQIKLLQQHMPYDEAQARINYLNSGLSSKLIVVDYSAIEMRGACEITEDDKLVEIFSKPHSKPHEFTASMFLNKPIEAITGSEKQEAKPFNFGKLYGMYWRTMIEYAHAGYGVTLTESRAKTLDYIWTKTFQGVTNWQKRQQARLFELKSDWIGQRPPKYTTGPNVGQNKPIEVECRTLLGRRIMIPCEYETHRAGVSISYMIITDVKTPNTNILNYPIQGSCGEGLGVALWLMAREVDKRGWKLCMSIHDEIVLEVPEPEANEALTLLKETMIKGMKYVLKKTPVEVEGKVCNRWSEGK